ncbi:MAG: hypothetical protein H8D78_00610 [Chloroflexi bacterium]|nr:hypothetical protein [Chloroflexota bacterium]
MHVDVETRDDPRIVIRSQDMDAAEEISSLAAMPLGGELDLIKRALRYYRPRRGLNITTRSEAPPGSGLGGSSALLMALSCALNEINQMGLSPERIIDLGANIEAQAIGIPTGKQDYFPPLFGGVQAIWFDVDGFRHQDLAVGNDLIERLNGRNTSPPRWPCAAWTGWSWPHRRPRGLAASWPPAHPKRNTPSACCWPPSCCGGGAGTSSTWELTCPSPAWRRPSPPTGRNWGWQRPSSCPRQRPCWRWLASCRGSRFRWPLAGGSSTACQRCAPASPAISWAKA